MEGKLCSVAHVVVAFNLRSKFLVVVRAGCLYTPYKKHIMSVNLLTLPYSRYEEWEQAAELLDHMEGKDLWKLAPASSLYHADVIAVSGMLSIA